MASLGWEYSLRLFGWTHCSHELLTVWLNSSHQEEHRPYPNNESLTCRHDGESLTYRHANTYDPTVWEDVMRWSFTKFKWNVHLYRYTYIIHTGDTFRPSLWRSSYTNYVVGGIIYIVKLHCSDRCRWNAWQLSTTRRLPKKYFTLKRDFIQVKIPAGLFSGSNKAIYVKINMGCSSKVH